MSTVGLYERTQVAIVPTDAVARAAELKWGVARLPGLVSAETLERWKAGWAVYSRAISEMDAPTVERVAPKIAAAIEAMMLEAEERGHQPLSVDAWEAPLADGRVLVVVRTPAEATAAVRRSGAPDGDGRERVVWSMDELAAVLPQLEQIWASKLTFPGSRVKPLTQKAESFAHDLVVGEDHFHDRAS